MHTPEDEIDLSDLRERAAELQANPGGPVATVGLCESVPERGGLLVHPQWMSKVRQPLRGGQQ